MEPYLNQAKAKTQRQILSFGGLNLSDAAGEGELRACENLSARRAPYLSQRPARVRVGAYENATAAYIWDEKRIVVENGILMLDGEALTNVSEGEKQFCVVNTKLIVWPDRIWIDLVKKEVVDMTRAMPLAYGGTFTSDTITAAALPASRQDVRLGSYKVSSFERSFWINVYDVPREEIQWDAETGWTSDGTAALVPEKKSVNFENLGGYIVIPKATVNETSGTMSFVIADTVVGGDFLLPPSEDIPRDNENDMGYYAVLKNQEEIGIDVSVRVIANIFKYGDATQVASAYFKAGDIVEITGATILANNREQIEIESVTDGVAPDFINVIKFASNSFCVPTRYCNNETELDKETIYTNIVASDTRRYAFKPTQKLAAGVQVLFWEEDFNWKGEAYKWGIYIWDDAVRELQKQETITVSDDKIPAFDLRFTAYTQKTPDGLNLQIPIPALDFICEKDNRLWGVCNDQRSKVYNSETKKYEEMTSRVICASALGMPNQFWQFKGISTDSYQVAVASEGDFTGICEFGGGVLCWKESELCKVLGAMPAEYALYTHHIAGVQKGSHKSLTNINETLYYASRAGVYAYAGGTPALISQAFGNHRYKDATAGTDGQRYYISLRDGEEWMLLSYDAQTALWMREDASRAVDFCLGERVEMLIDGKLYAVEPMQEEDVSWMAQFAPFYERVHGRKGYSRILLRMELSGWVRVMIKKDGAAWEEAWTVHGERTVGIPILPNRCDKFEIRLEGYGRCTVLSMVREFRIGSDK